MEKKCISFPESVHIALKKLEYHGYEAWIVGGAVRDWLLGKQAKDYDIATSATPDEILSVFTEEKTLEVGKIHGTIGVCIQDCWIEITTYRCETTYSDHRHPDKVSFSKSILEDLKRRDFTMNAIAYHPERGVYDPFLGRKSLETKQIVCVGDPIERFEEDALRILRCLRFSVCMGFSIEESLQNAIHSQSASLNLISKERLQEELNKLIVGTKICDMLLEYSDVFSVMIPEIIPCLDMPQNNPYHRYNVWEHIAHSVEEAPPILEIRLVMLLHDIGKPQCLHIDEDGVYHFKGHQLVSSQIAEQVLKRLKYSNKTIALICELVRFHDEKIETEMQIKQVMRQIGYADFGLLIMVKCADNSAKKEFVRKERIPKYMHSKKRARDIVERGECYSLSQLAVNGTDIAHLEIKDKNIGEVLNYLLTGVIEGSFFNCKKCLLQEAEKWKKKKNR